MFARILIATARNRLPRGEDARRMGIGTVACTRTPTRDRRHIRARRRGVSHRPAGGKGQLPARRSIVEAAMSSGASASTRATAVLSENSGIRERCERARNRVRRPAPQAIRPWATKSSA